MGFSDKKPTFRKSPDYIERSHKVLEFCIKASFAVLAVGFVMMVAGIASGVSIIGDVGLGIMFLLWFPLVIRGAFAAKACEDSWY